MKKIPNKIKELYSAEGKESKKKMETANNSYNYLYSC